MSTDDTTPEPAAEAPAEPQAPEQAPEPETPEQPPAGPAPASDDRYAELAAEVAASIEQAAQGVDNGLALAAETEAAFLAEVDATFATVREEIAGRHDRATPRITKNINDGSRDIAEFCSQWHRERAERKQAAAEALQTVPTWTVSTVLA